MRRIMEALLEMLRLPLGNVAAFCLFVLQIHSSMSTCLVALSLSNIPPWQDEDAPSIL